jgi:hypothetical protein
MQDIQPLQLKEIYFLCGGIELTPTDDTNDTNYAVKAMVVK